MDKFVCIRIVKANALDLSLFQFDYDLTFAIFFMSADKTIYGRYGSRSQRKNATKDISLEGLRETMQGVLRLHERRPTFNRHLSGKRGEEPKFKNPEDYPTLKDKYKPDLDYAGNVVKSCMHCHQIRDAERQLYRTAKKPIPDEVLYPWPMPDDIGLTMDAKRRARVASVLPKSAAGEAGFQDGDDIVFFNNQAVVSTADIQWVLHNAKATEQLTASVLRKGKMQVLKLTLEEGWRRRGDISWRVTTWDLRRMGTGGLLMENLAAAERKKSKLAGDRLALFIKHVGQYGAHAAAKRAGFRKGDIIVAVNGKNGAMTETDFLAYVLQNHKPGERVPVTVLRAGKEVKLQLPMQ
jgi:hypothetical protein